jgi:hypothetical protein
MVFKNDSILNNRLYVMNFIHYLNVVCTVLYFMAYILYFYVFVGLIPHALVTLDKILCLDCIVYVHVCTYAGVCACAHVFLAVDK